MGLRLCTGNTGVTCMYCSTSGYAFGPIFDSPEEAEAFLRFCETEAPNGDPNAKRQSDDPRSWTPKFLDEIHTRFVRKSAWWEAERARQKNEAVPSPCDASGNYPEV